MRNKIILIIIILTLSISAFSRPMKAAYVSTWNPGVLSRSEVDKTIDAAKFAGITDIFIQVRKFDDAYYESNFVKKAQNIKEDFDPLKYILEEAKENNIKIHAWFVICRIAQANYKDTLPIDKIKWLNVDKNGNYVNENNVFLDSSNPEARKYIVDVISEVASKYKVDGVHLDYIRYPNSTFGYTDNGQMLYTLETGEFDTNCEKWDNFRREQINKLVFDIHEVVKNKDKNIILSASIVSWGAVKNYTTLSSYVNTFQDFNKWLDNGWVDYVMPMIYKRESVKDQSRDYLEWLKFYKSCSNKDKIIPAIGAYLNTSDGILNQIKETEKIGYSSWILFDFNDNETRLNILKVLGKKDVI